MSGPPDIAAIFREHGPYVYTVLRSLGVHAADVDDAFQEVFVVIHRKLPSYEDRGSLRAWVYGICVRLARRFRSRRGAAREVASDQLPEPVDPRTPAEHLSEQQARAIVNTILDDLDDDKRAIFVLFELEELTMNEVAQSLEIPLQTAYSRLRAAREAVEAGVRRYRMRKEFK
ncbi:RNA polymerase sigma factor RpoE [Labilithrix luteola]|uniref:RNA polymerase sigma factor RpoE n=1 Tax=Labilithrix luteola TaxID=1391654 RepID=A0A0K1Q3Y8_9BACT|nr:sigma-70 family RNA polymerase sigma factor [Labilithrix luteola]AKV00444.1 RNA polymerase sigma factor RpoE [Labilithrix luteola]